MDMRCLLLLSCCLAMGTPTVSAQILGIIGSSTAAGDGASTFDSSWVARTALYYRGLGELTSYYDIAVSGTTTWNGMPSSFKPPSGNPQPPLPDTAHNVTKILQLRSNVVVVGYPSNDIAFGYTLAQYLANLRTIYDSVITAGEVCYITTTQPRDDVSPSLRQLLLEGRDSILNEFPQRSLNFWDPVVDPSNLGILAQYSAGDGIHLNDAGHAVIALAAEHAGIMTQAPLPLTLTSFNARKSGSDVILQWTTADYGSGDLAAFEVDRSNGNTTFSPVYNTGRRTATSGTWSWTDSSCPIGIVFYRLKWLEGSQENYSRIVDIDNTSNKLSIDGLHLSGGSQLVTELELPGPGAADLVVIDLTGHVILHKQYSQLPTAPALLRIELPAMANGEYVFRVVTPDGEQATRAFIKL